MVPFKELRGAITATSGFILGTSTLIHKLRGIGMAVPSDNPNPLIFRPKKDAQRDAAKRSLWAVNEQANSDEDSSDTDESTELEPIDADEIYGLCASV